MNEFAPEFRANAEAVAKLPEWLPARVSHSVRDRRKKLRKIERHRDAMHSLHSQLNENVAVDTEPADVIIDQDIDYVKRYELEMAKVRREYRSSTPVQEAPVPVAAKQTEQVDNTLRYVSFAQKVLYRHCFRQLSLQNHEVTQAVFKQQADERMQALCTTEMITPPPWSRHLKSL